MLTEAALDPYFGRVENQLGVRQVTPRLAGRNAAVVRRGAEALGLSGDYLYRNARGCIGSGVCAYGCPSGAKQFAVHGVAGLHVADGSVVPSALGVNPQITIMALSTRLADHLLGATAPPTEVAPARVV